MGWYLRGVVLVAAATLVASLAAAAPPPGEPVSSEANLTREVRRQLERLPYYGVFDLLSFKVGDGGVVTLGGYVLHDFLKQDAENAVDKVVGVTEVDNRIESLPASVTDDKLRWDVYRAVYREDFLSRYGSAADRLTVMRPEFRTWGWGYQAWPGFGAVGWRRAPFYGLEPVGEYAIHIIVNEGKVTLYGMVDTAADRKLAGVRAREVFGAFQVTNDLQVSPASARS
jgi:osmotically-inducible protein OsmY